MRTIELSGAALDLVVHNIISPEEPLKSGCTAPHYSSDWCFGGPIIEQENLEISRTVAEWRVQLYRFPCVAYGPTPLIAAMRCFVLSTFGDELEISEKLNSNQKG